MRRTVDTLARLIETIRHHRINYVIFNNHLDEMLQEIEAGQEALIFAAKSVGRAPEQYRAALEQARTRSTQVPRFVCTLARAFDELGVRYGSHDDRDGETRETYSMVGARIGALPLTKQVARMASAQGDPVLMGAPNVVRGGSQAGNVAAVELIEAGCCDALVSDYYYPALSHAAFQLADSGLRTLGEAWAMISTNPAQIMGLRDRGAVAEGKRADLTIVNRETRDIEATLVEGRITHLTGEVACRFVRRSKQLPIAAE